jgi:hypothetical protein
MNFKIGSQDVKLKFGVKFCRLLDEKYKIDYQGMEFGMGVMYANMGLAQKNVTVLADVIRAGTKEEHSQDSIDEAIEEYAEKEGGLKKLFEQVEVEMGKSPVVQETVKAFKSAQGGQTNPSKPTKK